MNYFAGCVWDSSRKYSVGHRNFCVQIIKKLWSNVLFLIKCDLREFLKFLTILDGTYKT